MVNKINPLFKLILLSFAGFFFFIFNISICRAQNVPHYSNAPVKAAHTLVEFIPEFNTVQKGKTFWIALRMVMDENWHVYWKNPGDSGLPTEIEWELPEGIEIGSLQWPFPQRIDLPPLSTYGYERETVLFTKISVSDTFMPGDILPVKAKVDWLACRIECIPGRAYLQFPIHITDQVPLVNERFVNNCAPTLLRLPRPMNNININALDSGEDIILRISSEADFEYTKLQFFPDKADVLKHSAEQIVGRDGKDILLKLKKSGLSKEKIIHFISGVLVNPDGWGGSESIESIIVNTSVSSSLKGKNDRKFQSLSSAGLALIFAFLGGLILNLMPCVLPVLSIKVLNLIQKSQESKRYIFKESALFTLGIVVTFWILACVLIILQEAGRNVGWGFQFQSPIFVMLMSALFFWLGLNLLGLFEIGTSLTRVENAFRAVGIENSFFNGVLTTIVATPCTAPFMGSALGFAIGKPPIYVLLIFTFLGIGLAAPFFILSMSPRLLKSLPKPGPWMVSLKRFFSVLFFSTVVWLLWVLHQQQGRNVVLATIVCLLFLAAAGLILNRSKSSGSRVHIFVGILVVLGLFIPINFSLRNPFVNTIDVKDRDPSGIQWQRYDSQEVVQYINDGRIVFIDFTASWCLSCQVNDIIAFKNKNVIDRFRQLNIVPFKADWTNYDEEITQALADYGKNSIPLYVLYKGDENKSPVLLPEIITPGIILDTLENLDKK